MEGAAVVEPKLERGVAALVVGQGAGVDEQRAGEARLNDDAVAGRGRCTTSLARRQQRTIVRAGERRAKFCGRRLRAERRALVTRPPVMRAPATSRSRSRAIVSVSGSSGTPCELAPADVGAELLALELDLLAQAPGCALRLVERSPSPVTASTRPPAVTSDAVGAAPRAGVKDAARRRGCGGSVMTSPVRGVSG